MTLVKELEALSGGQFEEDIRGEVAELKVAVTLEPEEELPRIIDKLKSKTEAADVAEDGTILIAVLDTDPPTAADMANHYIVILDITNKRISQITASERLDFIRLLLSDEDRKLEDKMEELEEFQSAHNAISIADHARAVIKAAAEMQTDAMELEIIRQGFILSGLDEGHDKVKSSNGRFSCGRRR